MNELILYFSGIAVARFRLEEGRVYHRSRDPRTLEFAPEVPLDAKSAAAYRSLTRMEVGRALEQLPRWEEALAQGGALPPELGEYQPGKEGYLQRRVKNPLNVRVREGRLIAFLTPSRDGMAVLVRPGEEENTPLALWKDYPDRPLFGVEQLGTFDVPTRDGEKLSTDVYLPCGKTGRVPAILIRTPYNKEEGREGYYRFVHRGYAVVVQDVRGKGGSTGVWMPHYYEVEDGSDTLDWVAAQDWSDGSVGTFGGSYLGYVQWAAAASGNPHLKAMVSIVTAGSGFVDLPRRGGCYASGMMAWAFSVSGQRFDGALMEREDWDQVLAIRPLKELHQKALGYPVPFLEEYLRHPDEDDFWKKGNWHDRSCGAVIPAFIQSGWFDDNGMGTTEALELVESYPPQCRKVMLGPWQHSGNSRYDLHALSFGEEALRYDLDLLHLRWFDRFLRQERNGVEEGAPVEYYTVGEERWKQAAAWPVPGTQKREFYLGGKDAATSGGGGTLTLEPPREQGQNSYCYDPRDPAENIIDMSENELEVPEDYTRQELRADYLCYTTPPLEQPLTITGDCGVELYLSSDAVDTDVVVRLCDVDPAGKSIKLADALLGARYREGFEHSRLLTPGEVVKLELRTTKLSHRFAPGHRLRVTVTSSAINFIFPNSNTAAGFDSQEGVAAQNTLWHGGATPSRIRVPVEE